jgi:hypothetical protein
MKNFLLYVEQMMKERATYAPLSNWCTINSEAFLFLLLDFLMTYHVNRKEESTIYAKNNT